MAEGQGAFDVIKLIEPFDGYGDSNSLHFFLKNCEAMMKIVKDTEKKGLATLIFATKLTGKAQEVTQYKEFANWDEIKDVLLEQFTDKRPPSHFLTQIMNIKQNFREDIKNYGDRLKNLYNKYKETCHSNYSSNEAEILINNLDSIIINTFRRGLIDEKTQIRVIAEGTLDLDKAISLSIEIEQENLDNNKYKQNSKQMGLVRGNENFLSNYSRNNIFCIFCNISTHLTSECRKLRRHEQNQIILDRQNQNNPQYYNRNHSNNPRNNFQNNNNNCNYSNTNYQSERFARNDNRNFNNRFQNFNRPQFITKNPPNYSRNQNFSNNFNRNYRQNNSNFNPNNNDTQRTNTPTHQIQATTSQHTDFFPPNLQNENQNKAFQENFSGNNQPSCSKSHKLDHTYDSSSLRQSPIKSIIFADNQKQLDVIKFNSGSVKNSEVQLLLDTGADVSLLKESLLINILNLDRNSVIELKGITEQPMLTLGTYVITINLENKTSLTHPFHIIPENTPIKHHGLLGRDFLLKHKAKINYEDGTLQFENNNFKIFPSETVTIPARCEVLVSAKTNIADIEGLVAPKQISDSLFLASSLTKARNNKCLISILNISETSLTIPMPLVNVEPININEFQIYNLSAKDSKDHIIRLQKLINNINLKGLNTEESNSIIEICTDFSDIFYLEGDSLTHTNTVTHKIPTDANKGPINIKPYRLPFKNREIIEEKTEQMLKNEIISPSLSPWNSPLLVVPKKADSEGNPSFRVVVDFRKINDITTGGYTFPLPNITDILDQLGNSHYFSTLDLADGFHQVLMDEHDKDKTAFTTPTGHYTYNRMPFGLKGAPATFQRLMNVVLSGLTGLKCFIYLDDVVIYANSLKDHNERLIEIFQRLREHNLKLKPSKCDFLRKECLYLGHIITSNGIKPDPSKIECVANFPIPKNQKHVKSFLGLVGYYRKFIKNFAKVSKPLTKLLQKDTVFKWDNTCDNSFQTLKHSIISPPVLQYPDFTKPFIITTDASNFAIGAILSQGEINKDRPIAFASRTLNKAEQNYSTTEKELAAIVWAVKHFRPYVFGTKFKIVTDHKPLQYVFNIKDPGSRLTRFRLKLEEYNYEIIYKAGKINTNADALSRPIITINADIITNYDDFQDYLKTHIVINSNIIEKNTNLFQVHSLDPIVLFIPKNFQKEQFLPLEKNQQINNFFSSFSPVSNLNVSTIYHHNTDDCKMFLLIDNENSFDQINYLNIWSCLINLRNQIGDQQTEISFIKYHYNPLIKWEIIYPMIRYIFKDLGTKITIFNSSLITPDISDRETLLNEFHNSTLGGHQGVSRTYKKISQFYTWRGLKKDVKKLVKKCELCQKNKLSRKTKMPMVITTTASKPFERCFLDVVGPLPETKAGNKYILTFQDDLTKFTVNIPMQNQEASTVAHNFVINIICLYGLPETLITDQGTNFLSDLFKNTCKLLKIKKIQTTSYHPESNGALERSHRVLEEYLRHFISYSQTDWDSWLPFATFTYNTTPHSATKFSPFELLYGHIPSLPTSIQQPVKTNYTYDDFVANLKQKLQYSNQLARENLFQSKISSKENYDKRNLVRNFNVGDKVLLFDESVRRGRSKKLSSLWIGPYTIIKKLSDVNYSIQKGKHKQTIHANRLKHFYD